LVRRICRDCREPAELTPEQRRALGVGSEETGGVWAGRGCSECRGTGYRGRTGIYELLLMDEALRSAVQENASASRLERLGLEQGMRLLREDGLRVMREGVSTAEEVLRVASA
jgi:type II secretory ATPase GspE/PulE/Tfp pilus assembly ATPase PilB-like protein